MQAQDTAQYSIVDELWFGDDGDEAAEQEAARGLAARVAELVGVRPFPVAAQRLITTIRNPDYSAREVGRIIESDATLAARVLRVVNSAFYSRPVPCTSVAHGVVLLGAQAIGEVASGLVAMEMFKDVEGPAALQRDHAAVVAGLARHLGMRRGLSIDDVYTTALFHDLGKLLLLQVDKSGTYHDLLLSNEGERDLLHIKERKAFGYDHAVLAGHVLHEWGIPAPVPQAVAWHHQAARAYKNGGRTATLVALVRLADRLYYELERSSATPDEELIEALTHDGSAIYLGLSGPQLATIWDDLHLVCMESRQIFGGPAPTASPRLARLAEPRIPKGEQEAPGPQCHICGGESSGGQSCPRCQKAVCRQHAPLEQSWCPECDAEYVALMSTQGDVSLRRPMVLGAGIGVLFMVSVGVALGVLTKPGWLGALALAFVGLPLAALQLLQRQRRAAMHLAFLEEVVEPDRAPTDVTLESESPPQPAHDIAPGPSLPRVPEVILVPAVTREPEPDVEAEPDVRAAAPSEIHAQVAATPPRSSPGRPRKPGGRRRRSRPRMRRQRARR